MAEVRFEHVTKIFKSKAENVCAVNGLSLAIADHEFVVLVGPSGCGKSTALRLVAGLEEVSGGTIWIDGRAVNNVAPKDRDCAMVFQNYALYPHMTVFNNMAFSLRVRRAPKREIAEKVNGVAAMLSLDHLLTRKPAALSGGERQRVALGRAIVRRPKVFLFDEPLSNLDAKLRRHMRTEIKNLHRKLQTTIIYVTHDQEEAMTLGGRLVVMNRGVVQQCGTPIEVYNCPANRFVAEFIGTPPMNFLEGCIESKGDGLVFRGRGDIALTLAQEQAQALKSQAGKRFALGIRPEHLSPTNVSATDDRTTGGNLDALDITVTVVEPVGDRMHVYGTTAAGETVVTKASPTAAVEPGQSMQLSIDMSRAHLFAADGTG